VRNQQQWRKQEPDPVQGTFDYPVTCPDCGGFMRTNYDGMGLPVATCPNAHCSQTHFGDGWLKRNDYWTAGGDDGDA